MPEWDLLLNRPLAAGLSDRMSHSRQGAEQSFRAPKRLPALPSSSSCHPRLGLRSIEDDERRRAMPARLLDVVRLSAEHDEQFLPFLLGGEDGVFVSRIVADQGKIVVAEPL